MSLVFQYHNERNMYGDEVQMTSVISNQRTLFTAVVEHKTDIHKISLSSSSFLDVEIDFRPQFIASFEKWV